MTAPSTELVCSLDVDIEYDATPPKVLQLLTDLASRVAKYRADEPGDYLQVGPTITWSTSEHRSRWKATTSLYRQPSPSTLPQTSEVSQTSEVLTAIAKEPETDHALDQIIVGQPEPIATPVAADEPSMGEDDSADPVVVPTQPRKKAAGKASADPTVLVEATPRA